MSGAQHNKNIRLSEAQRLAWLRLIRSENIGPRTFRDLLDHTGSAERALDMLPELSNRGGKKRYRLCRKEDAEAELAAHEKWGARLVALGEPDYPPHLRHIDGPPPLLSVLGGANLSREKTVAIVGARNASLSGRKIAGQFAAGLSEQGFMIASGLARGIDAAAHAASLKHGTLAVFAGGINILYPPDHDRLLAEILDNGGSAISEMPFGWKPRGRDFPRRNRLISGVSLGVVVIEAAKASGSLHTARYALEQNRDIYAVPGSPLDPRSEGANGLIRQGATLVTCVEDVIEGLGGRLEPTLPLDGHFLEPGPNPAMQPPEPGSRLREEIISALGPTPIDLDELIRFSGAEARDVHVILLELELAGRLERHRGNQVSLLMV
ncbi:MAG: DNA-protecting protein DprA [Roseibium sp.]|uniref:DNA-processing protein DprA n=1 Tax=Roseibium sp. TaxID=1936156 RepID=UPI001B07EEC7|nr:DNA-processing protein DprA [Roseibium sp.]MBO6891223.1 DNA-protecting protein DprA [Roseibium sp.]MBO6928736.1 DNA-protecting protein DprA [Roseibium sp.]